MNFINKNYLDLIVGNKKQMLSENELYNINKIIYLLLLELFNVKKLQQKKSKNIDEYLNLIEEYKKDIQNFKNKEDEHSKNIDNIKTNHEQEINNIKIYNNNLELQRQNIFKDKCLKYLNTFNIDTLIEFKAKTNLLKYHRDLVTSTAEYKQLLNEYIQLLDIEYNFNNLLIKNNNEYKCDELLTNDSSRYQNGGGTKYKIYKYINKYVNNEDIKYIDKITSLIQYSNIESQKAGNNNIYFNNKINKYTIKYINNENKTYIDKINGYIKIQNGGNLNILNNIDINNIINNYYRPLHDILFDKNLLNSPHACAPISYAKMNYDEAIIVIDNIFNTKHFCFESARTIADLDIMNTTYKIMYKLKSLGTDILAESFNDELTKIFSNYILIELTLIIREYIYNYNLRHPRIALGNDDITVLYKGGNTIKMHFKKFIKLFNITDDIFKQSTINSDLDFMIKISYSDMYNNGMVDNEIISIQNNIIQIVNLSLIKIKNKFKQIIYSIINILNKKITENINKIYDIIHEYNNIVPPLNKINTTYDLSIKTFNHKIIHNSINKSTNIIKDYDNKSINKYSYQFNFENHTITKLLYFFSNTELTNFISDIIIPDHIVLSYLNSIVANYHNKFKHTFSLFRLKLINKININDIILPFSADYVDISININDDNNILLQYNLLEIKPKYNILPLLCNSIIPSIYYFFIDIYRILCLEPLFIFLDKKYDKRIKRILNIIIICLIYDGVNNRNIIIDYTNLLNILTANIIHRDIDAYYNNINHPNLIIYSIPNVTFHNIPNNYDIFKYNINHNYYLTLLMGNYYETIIKLYYITHNGIHGVNPHDIRYNNYCDLFFDTCKRMDIGDHDALNASFNIFSYEFIRSQYDKYFEDFKKYEKLLIEYINKLIVFLTNKPIVLPAGFDYNTLYNDVDTLF
jgi:hypothetical protein